MNSYSNVQANNSCADEGNRNNGKIQSSTTSSRRPRSSELSLFEQELIGLKNESNDSRTAEISEMEQSMNFNDLLVMAHPNTTPNTTTSSTSQSSARGTTSTSRMRHRIESLRTSSSNLNTSGSLRFEHSSDDYLFKTKYVGCGSQARVA